MIEPVFRMTPIVPASPLLPLDQPFHGLVALTGDPSVLTLSQVLCLPYLGRGETLVILDATNTFDVLLYSDAARAEQRSPQAFLDAIHLSRAYTCHQFEALITEHLGPAIAAFRPRAVLCLGLLDLLDDEDVPASEAARIARRMFPALRDVSRTLPVLAACPDSAIPGHAGRRAALSGPFLRLARWRFTVRPVTEGVLANEAHTDGASAGTEPPGAFLEPAGSAISGPADPASSDAVLIVRERPEPGRWIWTPTRRPGHAFRADKLTRSASETRGRR